MAACLIACAGCALIRHRKPPKPQAPVHQLVGTIVTVNDSLHFVLIDSGGMATVTRGTALKSFSDGQQTAVLAVSPEEKPPFVIADIVDGSPHQGDQVYQ